MVAFRDGESKAESEAERERERDCSEPAPGEGHCSSFPFELKETGEFHTPLAGILLGSPGRGLLQPVKKAWP